MSVVDQLITVQRWYGRSDLPQIADDGSKTLSHPIPDPQQAQRLATVHELLPFWFVLVPDLPLGSGRLLYGTIGVRLDLGIDINILQDQMRLFPRRFRFHACFPVDRHQAIQLDLAKGPVPTDRLRASAVVALRVRTHTVA